jgi:flagellar motor switch protein FliM
MLDKMKTATNAVRKIHKYDFHRMQGCSQEQLRALTSLHAEKAAHMGATFGELCRLNTTFSLISVQERPLTQLWNETAIGKTAVVFTTKNDTSRGLLVLDDMVALWLVDRMLGGTAETPEANRPLTELELQIARTGFSALLGHYGRGWGKTGAFTPAITGIYSGRHPEEIDSDKAIVCEFGLETEGLKSRIALALLLPECEALVQALLPKAHQAARREHNTDDPKKLLELIADVELPVSVMAGTAHVALADVVRLAVGDVIPLETVRAGKFVMSTGGRPVWLGRPLAVNGKLAIQVSDELNIRGM